ncbi:NAD-dependent glycerol-3-phosphate dehydrogenase carboxy-terminus family protein (macronuclear) [Tetrahymena thermophila SB210]|uniref:NAD-dependent glycerol-3-phosphate dehydrogenase carboxy-terminus family protein n=1 Tax=Tetrahymena thermophila (strain SB210) TaxID=312017 RepID=I7LTD8_TETTS|nr:NAD-dependent glycerol-3-phosphate dehydrogenase carboxy-terminus family protein [Tetrahymena thermophila SB210]EAR85062.2 NAD-dependent glycerol-3-phosphate dehydrogenase carboxy-terminus family protein [Tetrahymena thermophila SB210]|eukprot:XP_001032725.2 NAD-dependent glycerol-3-phosphate dehydrogenase carboxy-terminus family protein [Tetrahymena thermophila SB210]
MNYQDNNQDLQSTLQIDSARLQNYSSILEKADKQNEDISHESNLQKTIQEQNSQNLTVKVIGGDNNLSKNKHRKLQSSLLPPSKMMCISNNILENSVFPVIADENLDPDDLNKKINYGVTDNISKMDAKMVKIIQSKMNLENMKKKQMQYQQGVQKQIDEKLIKQQKQRNIFLDHRIKNCRDRSKKWQERKENHQKFLVEKEFLKQIMQDEYLQTQQEFWQKKDAVNSQSQYFSLAQQNLNKSTQFLQRNSININNNQLQIPQKDAYRPDTANTAFSNINNLNQQYHFKQKIVDKQQERNEQIKSLNLVGDRIGSNRSQTASTNQRTSSHNKSIASNSFYNALSSNVRQLHTSNHQKRDLSLQSNQLFEQPKTLLNNVMISDSSITRESQNFDFKSKSINKMEEQQNESSAMLHNSNLLSEIKIQRDFYIADPYTRSIIQESFTQPPVKKNLSLDQNSINNDFTLKQITPQSGLYTKQRYSNYLRNPTITNNYLITPQSINQQQNSTKFQSVSPVNSHFSIKKQDQKLSYDKRRYQCLNKIYQSKVNQLNQDEVFTEKMRKQKLQDLVRRKINNNFPGNYKLKINFSLVEKLNEQDDDENKQDLSLQQTLYQQNSLNINYQQQNESTWNTQSHQIYSRKGQKQYYDNHNLQHDDPSSDEDGEDIIKYIKNL